MYSNGEKIFFNLYTLHPIIACTTIGHSPLWFAVKMIVLWL